jgi:hypothetical protein
LSLARGDPNLNFSYRRRLNSHIVFSWEYNVYMRGEGRSRFTGEQLGNIPPKTAKPSISIMLVACRQARTMPKMNIMSTCPKESREVGTLFPKNHGVPTLPLVPKTQDKGHAISGGATVEGK